MYFWKIKLNIGIYEILRYTEVSRKRAGGSSLLHAACIAKNAEVLTLLLESGHEVDVVDAACMIVEVLIDIWFTYNSNNGQYVKLVINDPICLTPLDWFDSISDFKHNVFHLICLWLNLSDFENTLAKTHQMILIDFNDNCHLIWRCFHLNFTFH